MPGVVKNYYKKEKSTLNVQELKFIKCSRLIRLQDLQLSNLSNMMYESIINKNDIFNIIQEMSITNKVLLEKLESKNM